MSRWRDIKQGKQEQTKPKKTTNESFGFEPCAPLFDRFKAFCTDLFLITTPIFYIVIYLIMGSGEAFAQNKGNGWLIILGVNLLIIVSFWLLKAQTPGLKAYSLKLVNATTKGKVGFFQAVIRYALTLFSIISVFLMFLPYFRKDRRTFQDILSNTYIIEE